MNSVLYSRAKDRVLTLKERLERGCPGIIGRSKNGFARVDRSGGVYLQFNSRKSVRVRWRSRGALRGTKCKESK